VAVIVLTCAVVDFEGGGKRHRSCRSVPAPLAGAKVLVVPVLTKLTA